MNRVKFWCEPCDLVFKAHYAARCPSCQQPMRNMGPKWRVGKKGHREDWYPYRQDFWWWRTDYGNGLARKLARTIRWDKKRGRWVEVR